jgi:hypothetical protein
MVAVGTSADKQESSMLKTMQALGLCVAAAGFAPPAAAEVLDAVYRGTMVCGDLPFGPGKNREAIEVTIKAGTVSFKHVVRLNNTVADANPEQGSGTLDGDKLELQGAWKGSVYEYTSVYTGSFVRRSAELKGTQTWTDGSKSFSRSCTGSVKRNFKAFLPKQPAT